MLRMVSTKVVHARLNLHLVFLISLSFVITETLSDGFDPESIVFLGDDILTKLYHKTVKTTTVDTTEDTQEDMDDSDTVVDSEHNIPADLIEAINNIDDPLQFEKFFIGNDVPPMYDDPVAGVGLKVRFGGEEEHDKNYVPRSLMPVCTPRLKLVPLKAEKAGLMMKPPCLEVPRCGGCCFSGRKCRPVTSEPFTYAVHEAKFNPKSGMLEVKRRLNITMEHHTSCQCQCNVNTMVCKNQGKIFDNSTCKCVCLQNLENKHLCSQRGRQWNPNSCTCECKEVECKEGYFFDQEKCKCDF